MPDFTVEMLATVNTKLDFLKLVTPKGYTHLVNTLMVNGFKPPGIVLKRCNSKKLSGQWLKKKCTNKKTVLHNEDRFCF